MQLSTLARSPRIHTRPMQGEEEGLGRRQHAACPPDIRYHAFLHALVSRGPESYQQCGCVSGASGACRNAMDNLLCGPPGLIISDSTRAGEASRVSGGICF